MTACGERSRTTTKSVIVMGGGLAGLACATALADRGFSVRLYEKKPHLGGRAASYLLPDGEEVDNCQHVLLGCCTNLIAFYEMLGVGGKIGYFQKLKFADKEGRVGSIRAWPLPEPFHLVPSFLLFPSLGVHDKLAIGRAMMAILRADEPTRRRWEGQTMASWLAERRQRHQAIERFWRVVLVSALNEDLDRVSAFHGTDVFRKAFLLHRRGFGMGVPVVPLGDLYSAATAGRVTAQGGSVELRRGVEGIAVDDGVVQRVILDNGETATADYFVSALPFDAILELLPEELAGAHEYFRLWNRFEASPITGIHLWFEGKVMDEPYLTLLDRTLQWIFNKSQLYGSSDAGSYLLCVVSASHALTPMSRGQIIELALQELAEVLPKTRKTRVRKATVIKEVRATYAPIPATEALRPRPETPLGNFFVCGDWTATGWPATMESAVRSGFLCAEAVLRREGQTVSLLRPELPARGLARFLIK